MPVVLLVLPVILVVLVDVCDAGGYWKPSSCKSLWSPQKLLSMSRVPLFHAHEGNLAPRLTLDEAPGESVGHLRTGMQPFHVPGAAPASRMGREHFLLDRLNHSSGSAEHHQSPMTLSSPITEECCLFVSVPRSPHENLTFIPSLQRPSSKAHGLLHDFF